MAIISLSSNRDPEPLKFPAFAKLAQFVIDELKVSQNFELSIAFISIKEMTELNEKFRNKKGPTDVLSFPIDPIEHAETSPEPIALGDIIISPEVAEEQAKKYGNSLQDELNLLVVHGLLHLLGYDHIQDDEAQTMESLEAQLLKAWELQK